MLDSINRSFSLQSGSKRYSPPQQMGGDKCPCHGKVNECESDFPITTAQRTPPGGEASKTLCRHLSNAPYAVPSFTPSLPRGHIMAVPVTDPRLDQHTKMVRGQVEQRDTRKTSIRDWNTSTVISDKILGQNRWCSASQYKQNRSREK